MATLTDNAEGIVVELGEIRDLLEVLTDMFDAEQETTSWAKKYESVVYAAMLLLDAQIKRGKQLTEALYEAARMEKLELKAG